MWRTLLTPEGIYFQSPQYLFRWSDGRIRVWQPQTRFYRAAVASGVLYIGQPETGLMKMAGDSLEEVPGGRQFTDESRSVILPYDDRRILIGTRADGLFLADGTSVTRFPTEVDGWLRTMDLYRGAELPDDTFALATTGGGMAIIDRQGRLLQHLDAASGVGDSLYYVFPDRQGAVWVGMDGGIARVETPSPVSIFDRMSGLTGGSVSYIHRHAGVLYAATSRGVYYLDATSTSGRPGMPRRDTAAFAPVKGISTTVQCWWFLTVDDPSGRGPSQLLVATGDGLFRIDRDRAVPILESVAGSFQPAVLYQSKRNPGRVFVALFDGLASLRLDAGKWVFEGRVEGVSDEVRSIVEDTDGLLWLGTAAGGILRVDFVSGAQPGAGASLPAQSANRALRRGARAAADRRQRVVGWRQAVLPLDGGHLPLRQGARAVRARLHVQDRLDRRHHLGHRRLPPGGRGRKRLGEFRPGIGGRPEAAGRFLPGRGPALPALLRVPDGGHLPRSRWRGLVRRPRRPDPLRSRPPQDVRGGFLRAHPPGGRERRHGRSSMAAPRRPGRRPS